MALVAVIVMAGFPIQARPIVAASLGAVSGTVTGPGGEPAVDVVVTAQDDDTGFSGSAVTAADGTYTVSGLLAGVYTVRFWPETRYRSETYDSVQGWESRTPVTVTAGLTTTGIDASLQLGGSITGAVTDAVTGEPVADVRVVANGAADVGSATTDVSGLYEISGLEPGDYVVRFDATGHRDEWFDGAFSSAAATIVSIDGSEAVANVDATLDRGGTITGVVRDASSSTPVAGVVVRVNSTLGGASGVATSRADGTYAVSGLEAGSYRVYFEPPSVHRAVYYPNVSAWSQAQTVPVALDQVVANIDAHLLVGAMVTGTVTDAVTGAPVAGVRVSSEGPTSRSALTDASGAYGMSGLDPGEYRFSASDERNEYLFTYFDGAREYSSATPLLVGVDGPTTVDIPMEPSAAISGTVTDALGEPIPSATVAALDPTTNATIVSTSTATDGTYTLRGFGTGSYRIRFQDWSNAHVTEFYDDSLTAVASTPVSIAAVGATVAGIDATLAPAGTISGTVTDAATGHPVAGVRVYANGSVWSSTVTDASGAYTLQRLQPGSYTVQFAPESPLRPEYFDGAATWDQATPVDVGVSSDVTGIDAALRVGASITGTVVEAGQPVAGVYVTAYDADGATVRTVQTNETGAYAVPQLAAGAYRLWFSEPSGRLLGEWFDGQSSLGTATPIDVADGQQRTGVDVAMEPASSIAGTVTRTGGQPVASAAVYVIDAETGAQAGYASTQTNGSYVVRGLAPGTYQVQFIEWSGALQSEWYDDVATADAATPITLGSGSQVSGVDATLSVLGSISGTVTDASGNPAAGVSISLHDAPFWYTHATTTTAADGSYRFDGLSTGSYRVQFAPTTPTYVPQWFDGATYDTATTIDVAVDAPRADVDAVLEAAARLQGTVTDSNGAGIASVSVVVVDAVTGGHAGTSWTGPDGTYAVGGLAPGSYRVQFSPGSSGHLAEWYQDAGEESLATTVTVAPGEVLNGIDASLKMGASIAGTVSDTDGSVLAGIWVGVYGLDGWHVGGWTTGPDGTYAVTGLPAGSYHVSFVDYSGAHRTQWYDGADTQLDATPITLAEGEALAAVDATMHTGARLAGVVTGPDGVGLAGVHVSAYEATTGGFWATTGPDGGYAVGGLAPGSYRVQFSDIEGVYAPEYYDDAIAFIDATLVTVTADEHRGGLDAELAMAGSLSGTVRDESGQPIEGISVSAFASDWGGSGTTDSDGTYAITGLPAGAYTVEFADYDGAFVREFFDDVTEYSEATPIAVANGQAVTGIDAELRTGGALAGTVTSASGSGIADVLVEIWQGSHMVSTAYTNADGQYRHGGLPAGDYLVRFDAYDTAYLSEWYDDVASAEDATPVTVTDAIAVADAELRAGGSVRGRVTDDWGTPIAGARVSVWSGQDHRSTVASEDGEFEVSGLAGGDYTVSVSAGDAYVSEYYDDTVDYAQAELVPVTLGEPTDIGTIALTAAGAVEGTVTDATGTPLVDVSVIVRSAQYAAWASTDQNGHYRAGGLPAGDYTVEFSSPAQTHLHEVYDDVASLADATPVRVETGSTTSGVDAVLTKSASIAGTFTNRYGTPLAGFWVEATPVGDPVGRPGAIVHTGADGGYVLRGLAAGGYRVAYSDPAGGYLSDDYPVGSTSETISLAEGEDRTGLDMTAEPTVKIRGTVRGRDNAALSGIEVAAYDADGDIVASAVTSGGAYQLAVVDGSYTIHFVDADGPYQDEWYDRVVDAELATPVTATTGEVTWVDATLTYGGTVAGTVVDDAGVPAAGVTVDVLRAGCSSCLERRGTTAADGTYMLPGITPGNYVIQFADPSARRYVTEFSGDASTYSSATPIAVTVGNVTSADAVLQRTAWVSGRVVNSSGTPLAGIRVTATSGAAAVLTAADGTFRIHGFLTGTGQVTADDLTDTHLIERIPVDMVLGTETGPIDIVVYTPSTMTGTVSSDQGVPIPAAGVTVNGPDGSRSVNATGDGTFSITGLRSGTYTVRATDPAGWHFVLDVSGLAVPLEGVLDVDPVMDAGIRVAGTARDADGNAVGGLTVTGFDLDGAQRFNLSTAPDGSYATGLLRPTDLRIRVLDGADRFASQFLDHASTEEAARIITPTPLSVETVELALRARGTISGQVTGHDGTPLAGIAVRADGDNGPFPAHTATTITDAAGEYVLTALDVGSYSVRFTDGSGTYAGQWYDGAASEPGDRVDVGAAQHVTGIDVELDRLATIDGIITGPSGDPLAGIAVTASGPSSRSATSGADGTYRIRSLVPGSYTVQATGGAYATKWFDDAYGSAEATTLTVDFGDALTAIDVQLGTSVLEFASAASQVDESAGAATVTLVRRYGSALAASVVVTASSGTATAGSDFADTPQIVSWAPGEMGPKTLTVPIVDDGEWDEGVEQFTLTLSDPTGPTRLGDQVVHVVSIVDDDQPPGEIGMTVTDVVVDEAAGAAVVTVRRSGGNGGQATVDYATIAGTATEGSDFTATSGTLTWADSESGDRQITVTILDDGIIEPDETFAVQLSGATGATLSTATLTYVTILDDDTPLNTPPTLDVTIGPASGVAPHTVDVSFLAADAEDADLTYRIDFGDGTAAATGTANSGEASHVYTSPGVYQATVSVFDGVTRTRRSSEIVVVPDAPLVADAGDDRVAVAGQSVRFDGGGSRPDAPAIQYRWDFGDGASTTGRSPSHVYGTAGTYTVTLTTSFLDEESTDTATVTVSAPVVAPGLRVTVRAGSNLLSGADVSVVLPDGGRIAEVTGSMGTATLHGLADGAVTVYAYAPGYQPAAVTATLANGSGAVDVALTSGDVGAATLEHRRLDLQEIVDLGIDIDDPANQNIFEATINLYFVPDVPDAPPNDVELDIFVWERGVRCRDDCSSEPGTQGVVPSSGCSSFDPFGDCFFLWGDNYYYPTIDVVEGDPLIQWLVIPVRATFLKEFFEVKLIVQNLTSSFAFSDGVAELALPSGLALAPTAAPQETRVAVGPIPAGGGRTVTWVVRGDTEGSYDLSARYSAVLDPIAQPVVLTAVTREPLKVWGGSAVEMFVTVDDRAARWAPYHVTVELRNVADIPVYNASLELLDRPDDAPPEHAEYFFGPTLSAIGQLRTTPVIEAGQSFSVDYVVFPGIGNETNEFMRLEEDLSFIRKTGGNVSLVTHLNTQPGPPYATGYYDVRTDLTIGPGDTDDTLTLSWQALVPPAGTTVVGYTLYTRDEMTSGGTWSPVTLLDASTRSYVVRSTDRTVGRHYLVATELSNGEQVLRHRMVEGEARTVALGDSYSSGEGLPVFEPDTDTAGNKCHRSYSSYSRLLVRDGTLPGPARYHACSGAVIADAYRVDPGNDEGAPQLDRVNEFTDVVTLTMGGNDIGFSNVIVACVLLDCDAITVWDSMRNWMRQTDSVLNDLVQSLPCSATEIINKLVPRMKPLTLAWDAVSADAKSIALELLCKTMKAANAKPSTVQLENNELRDGLADLYVEIARRAPSADIYVMSYPRLFAKEGQRSSSYCPSNGLLQGFGFVESEMSFANNLVDRLSTQTEQAVAVANQRIAGMDRVHFVPAGNAFAGHELCTASPAANMLTAPVYATEYSYHPNALGQQLLAERMGSAIGGSSRFMIGEGQVDQRAVHVAAGTASLGASAVADGTTANVALVSPSGERIGGSAVARGAHMGFGAGDSARVVVSEPEPGDWMVETSVIDAGEGSVFTEVRIWSDVAAPVLPTPDVAIEVLATEPHLSVEFDASASMAAQGSVETYFWAFGDGTFGSGPIVTHDYASGALYQPVLIVTDSAGNSAALQLDPVDTSSPPVAAPDEFSGFEDVVLDADVLANDTDPDGDIDPSTVSIVGPPAVVVATALADGSIAVAPPTDWSGTDSFEYEVCDFTGKCATAVVDVDFAPVNDAPVAVADSATVRAGESVDIAVLDNDTDVDDDHDVLVVQIVTSPAHGTATVRSDQRSIRYVAAADHCGTDSFTYQARDTALSSAPATVSITAECDVPPTTVPPTTVPPTTVPPTTVPPTTVPPTTVPPTTGPPTTGGSGLVGVSPGRLLDTRSADATVDGTHSGLGAREAGSVTQIQIAGRGDVPADATAVALNVTVVDPAGDGYLTVFPCGGAVPNASSLNYGAGDVVANAVVASLGADGKLCIFTYAAAGLIVDVNGFVPSGMPFSTLLPARLLDTRAVSSTVDGELAGGGARPAGSVTAVRVTGRGGVPANARAAVLNVTVVNPVAAGYATVFPCGGAVPTTSNLNFDAGDVVANAVISKIGSGGEVCIFTDAQADLLVDVNGAFPHNAVYGPLSPARLYDSRVPNATIDGAFSGAGLRPSESVSEIVVAGRGGVPSDAVAAVLNVTAVGPLSGGYLTVFPCGEAVPNASNVNFAAGDVVPNLVIAKIGQGGKVCVYAYGATHLLVDVTGYLPAG